MKNKKIEIEEPAGTIPAILPVHPGAMTYEDIVMFLKSLKNPTRAEKQDVQPNDPHEV